MRASQEMDRRLTTSCWGTDVSAVLVCRREQYECKCESSSVEEYHSPLSLEYILQTRKTALSMTVPSPLPYEVPSGLWCRVPVGKQVRRNPGEVRGSMAGASRRTRLTYSRFHQLLQPDFVAFYSTSSRGNAIKYYERTLR